MIALAFWITCCVLVILSAKSSHFGDSTTYGVAAGVFGVNGIIIYLVNDDKPSRPNLDR